MLPNTLKQSAKLQRNQLDNFINLLASTSLNHHDFITHSMDLPIIKDFAPKTISDWRLLGLPLNKTESHKMSLTTRFTDISEQVFCVVDIESTGSISDGQIIEIGAVKIQNGIEIDRFETLVYCPFVPENITQITGLSARDLEDAPSIKTVLEKFRLFIMDAVFVAHNANFDYGFIHHELLRAGFGPLLNRRLCTVELARRTINSPKYNLGALKELFAIVSPHHRALSDALAAAEILKECIKRLAFSIQTTEDLIAFSKTAKMLKPEPALQNAAI